MWTADHITITLHADLADDPVVTAEIETPDGTVWIIGDLAVEGRVMTVRQVHMHGHDVGSGELGIH